MSDAATAARLLPVKELLTASQGLQSGSCQNNSQISLKKWRDAEQQVLSLLTARKWKVDDVSRQNIDYDIEGLTEKGEETFIEVKAIDYPGQPFTLTSNEEVVARQKGKGYQLALVRQTNDYLEVAFIEDRLTSSNVRGSVVSGSGNAKDTLIHQNDLTLSSGRDK